MATSKKSKKKTENTWCGCPIGECNFNKKIGCVSHAMGKLTIKHIKENTRSQAITRKQFEYLHETYPTAYSDIQKRHQAGEFGT